MKPPVLFDAYGTLFDEGKEAIDAVATLIEQQYNIPQGCIKQEWKQRYLTREAAFSREFDTILGANKRSLEETFSSFQLPTAEARQFVALIAERWSKPPLFLDVNTNIEDIRRSRICGILSNGDEMTVNAALARTGLAPWYHLTSERARHYKPDPAIFLQACRELGIEPEQTTYVGNSPVDIEGAKRAGLRMILLNRHGIAPTANGYTADTVIETLAELLPLL